MHDNTVIIWIELNNLRLRNGSFISYHQLYFFYQVLQNHVRKPKQRWQRKAGKEKPIMQQGLCFIIDTECILRFLRLGLYEFDVIEKFLIELFAICERLSLLFFDFSFKIKEEKWQQLDSKKKNYNKISTVYVLSELVITWRRITWCFGQWLKY